MKPGLLLWKGGMWRNSARAKLVKKQRIEEV